MKREGQLTDLEMAVMSALIKRRAVDEDVLLQQLHHCKVARYENTGCGFYITLEVDRSVAAVVSVKRELIQGVHISCSELVHGAGFILYVQDGYLSELEGYTYVDDEWPEEVATFEISFLPETKRRD